MFFDSDFMNYVGFQLYGGGTDPAYDSFRDQSDPFADELDAELFCPVDGYTARIIIHYHASFGDALYIRGDSYPLSWYSGSRCESVDQNTWVFELITMFDYHKNVEFKVLLNDTVWENGYNHSVQLGNIIEISPSF